MATRSGQTKAVQAWKKASTRKRAERPAQQRQHDAAEDPGLARAVDAGRLDQLVGDRGDDVLADQEDAEAHHEIADEEAAGASSGVRVFCTLR